MNELEIECLQSVWSPVQIKKILKKRQFLTNKRSLLILNYKCIKASFNPLRKLIKILYYKCIFETIWKQALRNVLKKSFLATAWEAPITQLSKKKTTKQTNKQKINKTKKIWDIYNKMFFVINPPVISSPQWNKHPLI